MFINPRGSVIGSKSRATGLIWVLCVAIAAGVTVAANQNGRGERLVVIASDRAGGTASVANGRGERATVYVHWHAAATTVNGRGDVLRTGPVRFPTGSPARRWRKYP